MGRQPAGLFQALGVIALLLALIGMGYGAWTAGWTSRVLGSEFTFMLLVFVIFSGSLGVLTGMAWIYVGSMGGTVNELVRMLLDVASRLDDYSQKTEPAWETRTRSGEDSRRQTDVDSNR